MCEYCHRMPCLPRCPNYDPANDPQLEIVAHCPICNEPVCSGDDAIKMPDGTIYHFDCFCDEYRCDA